MVKNKQKEPRVVDIDYLPKVALKVLESNPVKKLTYLVLAQSIIDKASDLHIRKTKKESRLAYRIDGKRYDMVPPPSYFYEGMISSEITILLGDKNVTTTRIRVRGKDNLESDVSLANISESGLHLKFRYN